MGVGRKLVVDVNKLFHFVSLNYQNCCVIVSDAKQTRRIVDDFFLIRFTHSNNIDRFFQQEKK